MGERKDKIGIGTESSNTIKTRAFWITKENANKKLVVSPQG